MKRWVAVCAVVLAMGPGLKAQTAAAGGAADAAKQAKVQELFDVMHMDRTVGQMMSRINRMIEQSAQTLPGTEQMTAQQKALAQDFMHQAMNLSETEMSWKSLEPEYERIYAATFSIQELDAIIAFYKSPAGQAMLDKTPELTQDSMQVVQRRMVELQPKMRALQEQFMEKIKATEVEKPAVQPKSATPQK